MSKRPHIDENEDQNYYNKFTKPMPVTDTDVTPPRTFKDWDNVCNFGNRIGDSNSVALKQPSFCRTSFTPQELLRNDNLSRVIAHFAQVSALQNDSAGESDEAPRNYDSDDSWSDTEATPDDQLSKADKPSTSSPPIVFVWDLDETLIIFNSLLTEEYSRIFATDERTGLDLGSDMEELIYYLAENYLFFEDLEDCDQTNISQFLTTNPSTTSSDSLNSYSSGLLLPPAYNFSADKFGSSKVGSKEWKEKISHRYNKIHQLYLQHGSDISEIFDERHRTKLSLTKNGIDNYTGSWSLLSAEILNLVQARSCSSSSSSSCPGCHHVLVTTTQLVPAIAKLLLYNLAPFFQITNIYSASKSGKEECFRLIKERFGSAGGKRSRFLVIGDSSDEEKAASKFDWPFWKVSSHYDLAALKFAIEKNHIIAPPSPPLSTSTTDSDKHK